MKAEKVFAMSVGSVYPLLVAKVERKGRTRDDVDTVTCWLTGYSREELYEKLDAGVSYRDFFAAAPSMNPNRRLINGVVCGIRVEDIEDPLMREIRYLDKLVDELARGKKMESILRVR